LNGLNIYDMNNFLYTLRIVTIKTKFSISTYNSYRVMERCEINRKLRLLFSVMEIERIHTDLEIVSSYFWNNRDN